MRTIIFLSSLFFFNLSSFSQTIDSIIDTNKIWYTHIYIYCCEQVNTEVIGIGNIITINDTAYYTVLRSTGGVEMPLDEYGLIREENNRFYYKTSADKPEHLIYDFSISEGDTVKVYGLNDWTKDDIDEFQYKCDSIRTREYYQIQRNVYFLTAILGQVPEYWIEGIGSTSGILHSFDGRVGGDAFYLSCVKYNGNFQYRKNPSEPCIKIALGYDEDKPTSLNIFPNPVESNKEFHIKNAPENSIFELSNPVGQIVCRKVLTLTNYPLKIDLTPGIYFYRIINENEYYLNSGKIIIK